MPMMLPHHLSRALADYLAGPPEQSQKDYAARAGVAPSKLCRLLQNRISCDRDTLDLLLTAIPEPEDRRKIVNAYIRDYVSPGALLHTQSTSANPLGDLDIKSLSPKAQAVLRDILCGPHVKAFERMLLGLGEVLK